MSGCPVAHDFDLLDPVVVADPFTVLGEWRSKTPVFYVPSVDHYVVTRYADIEQILLDRDSWSAANASSPLTPVCPAAQEVLSRGFARVPTLNNADPPRHGPMRKSVLSVMTPRRLRSLEPVLREYAAGLVEGFRDRPVVDLVESFAFPFPGFAAFSLLGFPASDTDMLKDWSRNRVLLTYGRLPEDEQVATANDVLAMWQYVEAFVADRWASPRDDLTSDLVRLSREKPDQLNQFDIVNIVYSMALAGHETTTNTIGSGVFALLAHGRSQWQRLVEDPSLIPNAVEEILRFEGPVLYHRRIAKVDTVVGGVPIPAGAKVMMAFGSADRDPEEFGDDADSFRVDRRDAELHLAFGKGPHLCLGAPLGRLETRLALELLTSMVPDMELVPGQSITYVPNALFRGLTALLVAPRGVRHAEEAGALPQAR
ncbi:MAG TPA: cytochrome P450 [Acidimicrobiales bacterium]|nr:cytochrome P450 [Acidimicrobiales bacterium]